MTASPTKAPLRLKSRRSARRAGLSSSWTSALAKAPSVASVMASCPQSRIDKDVGDIGDQIERDIDRCRNQHHALDDRVVAIEDGIDNQLTEAWNRKYLLSQHRAGEQRAQFECAQGDYGR